MSESAVQQHMGPPPSLDLEASPVPGQIGSAVLDLNGQVVYQGGLLSPSSARTLFKMLVEVAMLPESNEFRRMTVAFSDMRYTVARDDVHIFVVQTRGQQ